MNDDKFFEIISILLEERDEVYDYVSWIREILNRI
uniref:Uncharacterized protein n=1 Tax=viral metagenome TaxID=1070528 RepID=A0A6C0EQP5_9ZZZZ